MLKFTKFKGAIRHSEIQTAFNSTEMKNAWISFIFGQTMCLIEEHKSASELSNQGVYPIDLERFCRNNNIECVIENEEHSKFNGLSKEAAREFAIANCRLAGLPITPEILEVADQLIEGRMTTTETIEKLLSKDESITKPE